MIGSLPKSEFYLLLNVIYLPSQILFKKSFTNIKFIVFKKTQLKNFIEPCFVCYMVIGSILTVT